MQAKLIPGSASRTARSLDERRSADYYLLERGDAFDSRLFDIARHLVRLADELPKDDAKRLREYRAPRLESLKFQLFSPAPISTDSSG